MEAVLGEEGEKWLKTWPSLGLASCCRLQTQQGAFQTFSARIKENDYTLCPDIYNRELRFQHNILTMCDALWCFRLGSHFALLLPFLLR